MAPTGEYGETTRKAVGKFQLQVGLPVTGEADATTVGQIEYELAVLDTQPYKKKGGPPTPVTGNPGDPVIP